MGYSNTVDDQELSILLKQLELMEVPFFACDELLVVFEKDPEEPDLYRCGCLYTRGEKGWKKAKPANTPDACSRFESIDSVKAGPCCTMCNDLDDWPSPR